MNNTSTTIPHALSADPRPVYAEATRWVAALMRGVDTDAHTRPTPCSEFDVAALGGHLLGTAHRSVALAQGQPAASVPMLGHPFDATAYAETTDHARTLWSDDTRLDAPVSVPWGTVPGRGALWGYVNETLVHGWDLAVATGQPSEAPAGLAEATLPIAQTFIGADIRDDAPFDPVVASRADAGATERLANWSGRSSASWLAGV